jgi:2-polyprenyl-3-methyl-5-hydroxy-6-metoxy-1,4-benzoquinol methylase
VSQDEGDRVEELSSWYLNQQLSVDKRLIEFRYRALSPHFTGAACLELGPAEGHMTRRLLGGFERLTVVEGSKDLLDLIPGDPRLTKIHSLFEDYEPATRFDTIVMEHILEHIATPGELLTRAQAWLAPEGRILVGVPNGHSIHRLVATKMGLLSQPCQLNSRDHKVGHRRVYTPTTLREEVESAGLRVIKLGGVFFKPVSNSQMEATWTDEMFEGFYELGHDFPEHAAELYAVACAGTECPE